VRWTRALLVAALLVAARAHADTPPSVWDRAKNPEEAVNHRVHLEVQRRLAQRARFDIGETQALAARAMLERVQAATSNDPRLRFDLGTVYLMTHDYKKAAEVLKAALAFAPDHPAAEEAWLRLAFACGHIGEHACERSG
jgi:uncharacterized protein HemY